MDTKYLMAEIDELRDRSQYSTVPFVLAPYATLFIERRSVALKSLARVESVWAHHGDLMVASPAKIEKATEPMLAPVINITTQSCIVLKEGFSGERAVEILQGMCNALDHVFFNCLTKATGTTEIRDLPRNLGLMFSTDVQCIPVAPDGARFKHSADGNTFEFGLGFQMAMVIYPK